MKDLCPTQQLAFDRLLGYRGRAPSAVLIAREGMGKTAIFRRLADATAGRSLAMADYLDRLEMRVPEHLALAACRAIRAALAEHEVVLADDISLLGDVCYEHDLYWSVYHTLVEEAAARGRTLYLALLGDPPSRRGWVERITDLTAADYTHLGRTFLGPETEVDFERVHRFAPKLDIVQLETASRLAGHERPGGLATDDLIESLRKHGLGSNIDIAEVEAVDLATLRGLDDVIERLETHVIGPLEDEALARTFSLVAKRGVLLCGPPGTGKTTIGRALAHRLRGKFFRIDGRTDGGEGELRRRVDRIFVQAIDNAPSVIFIDDGDAILEEGEGSIYHYLLTRLDGLESRSASRVCVVVTAMESAGMPAALLRSGRIDLCLEMRLPGDDARRQILEAEMECLPPEVGSVDIDRLVAATDGLTGADLKRLAADSRNLLAADVRRDRPRAGPTDYFLDALAEALGRGGRSCGFVVA